MRKRPYITAHTGCGNTPYNSLASAMEGIRAGADYIEVDVRASKDGVAVLAHDPVLRPADGVSLDIESLSLNELRFELRRFEDENGRPLELVALDELLDLAKRHKVRVNLDLKTPKALPGLGASVRNADMRDEVLLTGCRKEEAKLARAACPDLQVMLNTNQERLAAMMDDCEAAAKLECRDAIEAGCCGINVSYRVLSDPLLERANGLYLPVSVWTVDDEDAMRSLYRLDIWSITTKRVPELVRIMGEA